MNLPGAKIFIDTVTDRDFHFVDFTLKEGVDVFSVSFVEKADDILTVRDFVRKRVRVVHVVAKIERAEGVRNIDEILDVADAILDGTEAIMLSDETAIGRYPANYSRRNSWLFSFQY